MRALGETAAAGREFKKSKQLEGIELISWTNRLCGSIKGVEDSLQELCRKRNKGVEAVALTCFKHMHAQGEDVLPSDAEDAGEKSISANTFSLITSTYKAYLENNRLSGLTDIQSRLLLSHIFVAEGYSRDLRGKRHPGAAKELAEGAAGVERFVERVSERMHQKLERLSQIQHLKLELLSHLKELREVLGAHYGFFCQALASEYSGITETLQLQQQHLESECASCNRDLSEIDTVEYLQTHTEEIKQQLRQLEEPERSSLVGVLGNSRVQPLIVSLLEREGRLARKVEREKVYLAKRDTVKTLLRIHLSNLSGLQKNQLANISYRLARLHCLERIKSALLRVCCFIVVIELHHLLEQPEPLTEERARLLLPRTRTVPVIALGTALVCAICLIVSRAAQGRTNLNRRFIALNQTAMMVLANCALGVLFHLGTSQTTQSHVCLGMFMVWWVHIGEYTLTFKARFAYLDSNFTDIRNKALQQSGWFVLITWMSLALLFLFSQEVYRWRTFAWPVG